MSKNRRRPHRGRREKKRSRHVIQYHPDRGTGCILRFSLSTCEDVGGYAKAVMNIRRFRALRLIKKTVSRKKAFLLILMN